MHHLAWSTNSELELLLSHILSFTRSLFTFSPRPFVQATITFFFFLQLLVSVFWPHSSSHLWNADFILSFALQKNEKPTVASKRKHHLSRV